MQQYWICKPVLIVCIVLKFGGGDCHVLHHHAWLSIATTYREELHDNTWRHIDQIIHSDPLQHCKDMGMCLDHPSTNKTFNNNKPKWSRCYNNFKTCVFELRNWNVEVDMSFWTCLLRATSLIIYIGFWACRLPQPWEQSIEISFWACMLPQPWGQSGTSELNTSG